MDEKKSRKRLFIISGQSNAQGVNKGPRTEEDKPDKRLFQWNRETKKMETAVDPLKHYHTYNENAIGFGITFGKEFLKEYPNDEIYLLCCAKDACGLVNSYNLPFRFDLDFKESMWLQISQEIDEVLDTVKGLELSGVLWMHGESDVLCKISNQKYSESFQKLVNFTCTKYNNNKLLFIIHMSPYICYRNLYKILKTQNNIRFIDVSDMNLPSDTQIHHFEPEVQRCFGKKYAKIAIDYLKF